MRKKIIALCLAGVMAVMPIAGMGGTMTYAENTNAVGNSSPSVSTMKLNLLEKPLGVDKENLSFSWAMEDGDMDEYQTAYQIVVGTTEAAIRKGEFLCDTGWVTSAQSSGVKADFGGKLSDNSLYYWSVRIKDKDGKESGFSAPQAFTTAVGSGWETIKGIWYQAGSAAAGNIFEQHGWTDYAVEMDVKTDTVVGIAFRGVDAGNNYVWQIRTGDNKIAPHYTYNGTVASYNQDTAVSGLDLPKGEWFRVKIQALGDQVTTYVKLQGSGQFTEVSSYQVDKGFAYGSIGFRTGRTESGSVDNLEVYQVTESGEKGEVLYKEDFEGQTSPVEGCTVSDGVLNIPNALLTPALLGGDTVYPETGLPEKGSFIFARDSFRIEDPEKIEKAVVSVTAKTPEKTRQYVYNLYVNGHHAGLGPSRFGTDPSDGSGVLYYNTYDVTEQIRAGENVIGAINYTRDEKSFLCQLTVFYKDGTKQVVSNTGNPAYGWKVKDGTNAFGDNGTGGNGGSIGTGYFTADAQNLNANAWPFGWNEPGFAEDASWTAPEDRGNIVGSYDLAPYTADPVGRYETEPASVTKIGEGHYFLDMGKEIVGGLKLQADAPAGGKMELRYGEELSGTNTVKWQMRTGNRYREYWTLKAGEQTLENTGMMTYRYVEILNCPAELTVDNVRGIAIRQAFSDEESEFHSSDELLNRIYEFCKYSIKATNQDLRVDSQSRERGAYEGDVLINALSGYSFEDDYTLARFSNEYLATHRTWPVEYVYYTIINAWNDYLYTGNSDSLENYYNILCGNGYNRSLYWNLFQPEYGLLKIPTSGQNTTNAVLVDWPNTETDGYVRKDYNTVMNAVACGAFTDLANIAGVLGKTEDQAQWKGHADTLKAGLLEQLYDEGKGAFRDGVGTDHCSQHATAFALAYGIYRDQEMAERMADYIRSQGEIRTSVYGSWFLLEGLYNAGAGNVAMDLMTSEGTRSWKHVMDDLGATITTEAWDPANKSNMTYSHPWGSAPGSQIVRGMFGIQPLKAGFEEFQVKFQPGDVAEASVKVPTVKGSIRAGYTKGEDSFECQVTVPANTTAVVYIPRTGETANASLTVDGKKMGEAEGDFLKVTLGSGTHTMTTAEKPEEKPEVLAEFTFDDEETGFTNGYGVAAGTYTLQDHDGGKALYLDGTSQFLEVKTKDGGSLLSGVKELTVSFQAKPDKKDGNWLFYAAPDANSQQYPYEKYLGILGDAGGNAVAQRFKNSGSRPGEAKALADGDDWYYLTVVQTETETILYINGEEAAREPSSYSLTDILGENSILYIGKANWEKGEYYKGLIDNYKIIGRALSAEEVKKLADEYTTRPVYFDNALSRLSAVQSGRNTFEQITDNAQFEPGKEYLVVCGDQVLRWNGSSLKGETPEGIAGINTSLITLPDTLTGEEGNTYLWCMQKAYNGDGEQQYRMYNVSAEKQEKRYWNLTNGDGKKLYAVDENNDGNYNKLSFVKNNDGSFNVVTKFDNRSFYMGSDGTINNANGTSPVKIYKRQIESEGIQYSTDSGQTWQMMSRLSDQDAPEGEYVCTENLWRARIPKDAKTIRFRGKYQQMSMHNGEYKGGIYATEEYNLAEFEAENCFYGAPVVDELSKDTTVGGSWGKVDEINDLGDASRDIPEGAYARDPNLYYATSEFYDYYSDYELWGKKLKDSSKTEYEDQYDDQPLFSWNLAISNLYQNSEGVYPLYFGGSRMLNAPTGKYLRSQLWNYRTQIACGNGFAGVNTELKPGETGRVFPNMGLLNQENPLSTLESGNVLLKNSEIESPYFNKEFLTGKNQEKAVYGAVYENVEFPFERDTESGYWTFDSAKKHYAVRMMQDTKTGEYYLERTGSSDETKAVTYAGRPFFFPFNQGGDYTEKGKAPYSVANLDYMFGAKVEVPFSLSENRTTTVKKDENGKDVEKDCIFTFSGDDDVWIFVEGTDGKEHLVLDIGGSHGAVSGAIDFTTGNVAVSGKWNYLNGDTTASAMSKDGFLTDVEKYGLSDAYVTENDQWIWHSTLEELGVESADNKFEPYKEYKIKVYYMERGLDQSNLRITFNFAKNKNAEIQKIWSDGEERHAGDSIDMCLYQAEGSKTTDVKVTATEDIGDGQSESGEIALNAGNRWSYKWGRLKPNVDYDVTKAEYQYYIGEKHVPDGYRVRYYDPDGEEIPPIELTLTDGTKVKAVPAGDGVKITAKNYLPGTLALVKEGVDEGTGAPVLPGVGFELYNASVNEDGSWTKTGLVTDGAKTTDQGGNVVFDDLIDGNYLLYETKAADRYLCPEEPWKITVDGRGNVTVMLNDGTEVTQTRPGEGLSYKVITNEKLPLKLSILKVDSQDAEVTLAGAQFVMKKGVWDKNEKMFHEDSEVAPYSGTSDPSGLIEMKALLPGEYRLEEIQAPDGYSKLVKPIILRIEKDGGEILSGSGTGSTVTVLEENSLKITVANAKGYVLPDTGGTGTYGYTITGSILLFLALVAFSIDTWRRRQTCREGGKRTEKGPHDKVTCQ